jgi:hypothetical protein
MSKLDYVKGFFKKMDRNALVAGIAIVGILVVGGLIYANSNPELLSGLNIFGASNDQLAKKAIDYINNNGLAQSTASLVSVSEESGLVKIKIDIGGSQFDSYVTKDGKLLFPQVLKMEGEEENNNSNTTATTEPTEEEIQNAIAEIQKTDSPMLEAYVVSMCPFGLQMQRVMADAINSAPQLAQYFKARYMGEVSGNTITSMHGDDEAKENLRQICIRDEQASKYWNYVACYIKAGDASGCEKSTGIDSAKLNACTSSPSRGVAYAKEDFDLNIKYGVTGSPTLILGEKKVSEFYFGGRTSDAAKKIVCAAFNSQPSFCQQTLNTAEAASSFSETYEGAGTGGTANCE